MPNSDWGFAFFTPKALPAHVTFVTLLDDHYIKHTFRMLDGVHESLYSVGKWDQKVTRMAQLNKVRHLPIAMIFCWDSIVDKKTYETKITFSQSMRDTMITPYGYDMYGETAWYNTLLIGLAPEGKVQMWLQTMKLGANLPVEAATITTASEKDLRLCKSLVRDKVSYKPIKRVDEFIKDKTYPYGEW